jgi:hypothetical protein
MYYIQQMKYQIVHNVKNFSKGWDSYSKAFIYSFQDFEGTLSLNLILALIKSSAFHKNIDLKIKIMLNVKSYKYQQNFHTFIC